MKPTHHKKEENANIDKKIKYARSVFLNAGGHTSKISLATKVMTSTIQE
jgi:prolyl-tRNA editing enzyme YbaK/EbsC (Cys-tRNA(Pro) deacylase)